MLNRLAARQQDINVAIIGIGSIGNGLVYQCHNTPHFKPVAIADIKIERAITCAKWLGLDYQLVDSLAAMNEACLLYTSPSPRDRTRSRMPSSA